MFSSDGTDISISSSTILYVFILCKCFVCLWNIGPFIFFVLSMACMHVYVIAYEVAFSAYK